MRGIKMTIGEYMKTMRKSKGFTQREVADKIGIAEKSVRRYENGVCGIPLSRLSDYADALNMDLMITFRERYER